MSTNAIDTEKMATPEAGAPQPKTMHKRAKSPKKAARATKPPGKPKADRANKKAEVIALMKRAKGTTLDEIMAVTKWQAHTVRRFVSILGSKGGEKSSRPRLRRGAGLQNSQVFSQATVRSNAAFRFQPGAAFLLV
jgi:Protein of unknown function (DUF3489)